MDQPSFKLFGFQDAAQILGISRRTLDRLKNSGDIAFVKLNGKRGKVLFSAGELRRFVEELEGKSASRAAELYDIKSRPGGANGVA